MTDLPTYAEMMAVADKRCAWEKAQQARYGFVLESWSDDGDVYGCPGHVDRLAFVGQFHGLRRELFEPDLSAEVSVDDVQHCYALFEYDERGDGTVRWAVADETKPDTYVPVMRAVTADDPGAEPVTMLDL
jgi:hypothetical protein